MQKYTSPKSNNQQGFTLIDQSAKRGFTLIELSIVLVIIGLIVGGVLVGQDLIKAAQVRADITQLEKYNTSVNTFRNKYNGLPGDLPAATASSYGIYQTTHTGQGNGDGNGFIEDANGGAAGGGANTNTFAGEIPIFWLHLSEANIADGSYGTTGNSLLNGAGATPPTGTGALTGIVSTIAQSMPAAKTGGAYFTVISGNGFNYFALLPISSISAAGVYTVGTTGLTPIIANQIDTKIDDGQPETGIVLAAGLGAPTAPVAGGGPATSIGALAPSFAAASTANKCVIGTGAANSDTYNLVASTGGNNTSCGLVARFN